MNDYFKKLLPLITGCAIGAILYLMTGWWGFWLIFPWIGLAFTIAWIVSSKKKKEEKDLGRRIAQAMFGGLLLIFFGFYGRENMQIEETVFYIAAGVFGGVLIHYMIAKIVGPLFFSRGYCGWGCWTAALLEWLPIKDNKPIPKKLTYIRIPVLIISLLIPILFIVNGYDYIESHLKSSGGRIGQLHWFLAGNGVYYITAVTLAFVFRKRRAFCKIACPVSMVMKGPAPLSITKVAPSGEKCIECGACNKHCPMDVDVMSYISKGEKVKSTECILCGMCKHVCPVGAVK